MLLYAVLLFALAAVGGLYLASRHWQGNPPPLAVALIHGLLAVLGLVVVIRVVMAGGNVGNLPIAIGLFAVAAIGGLVLFALHAKGKALPKPLIAGHALVAVAGFLIVLLTYLG